MKPIQFTEMQSPHGTLKTEDYTAPNTVDICLRNLCTFLASDFDASLKVKVPTHLYTTTYRETRPAAVYNLKSGMLTSTSSKWCGAISCSPLHKWMDFGSAVSSL